MPENKVIPHFSEVDLSLKTLDTSHHQLNLTVVLEELITPLLLFIYLQLH